MSRTMRITVMAILMVLALPVASLAQGAGAQAPSRGDMLVSGNVGFVNAFDDDFDDFEAMLSGTFEYYTTPEISWRGLLGFTSFDAEFPGGEVEVDVMWVNANFVYNWWSGRLQPYVTGGLGLYGVDASGPGLRGADDTEIGINGGGGLHIFLNPDWAIKFEGLFHTFSGEEPDTIFAGTVGASFRF